MDDPLGIFLERVYFTRSVVIAIPGHNKEAPRTLSHAPQNTLNVARIEERPGHFLATMTCKINPESDESDPYMIDMECLGMFRAANSMSLEDQLKGVTIIGHSVLYGAIREAISWLTGRQPYGALNLGLSMLKPEQHTENPPGN